jgi:hypothetical protein
MTLKLGRPLYAALVATLIAVAMTTLVVLPMITYSTPFAIPDNYDNEAFTHCAYLASNTTQYNACLNTHLLPPVVLEGKASASYYLVSYGTGPYPAFSLVTQGNKSALVYWHGSSIAMAEVVNNFDEGEAPELLPPGSLQITDVRMTPSSNGLIDFSATVYGLPQNNLSVFSSGGPTLYFDYPGYGINTTYDGVTWHSPQFQISCGGSGGSCVATRVIGPVTGLRENATYPMTIVLFGYVSGGTENTTETYLANGETTTVTTQIQVPREWVYVQTLKVAYPGSGVDAAWVTDFMDLAGTDRGVAWALQPALDGFAQSRFDSVVNNYQIADYDFEGQAAAYFNGTGKSYNEEVLYPGTFSPSGYAQYLQSDAPAHWSGLLDTQYTQYGFYLGTGPAVSLIPPCPVTEVFANQNVTQVAIQSGCKYQIIDVTYLVLILTD